MKKRVTLTAALAIMVLSAGSTGFAASDSPTTKATVMTSLSSMPLAFTENQGQWDEQVLFRTNAGGATMWFTKDGAYYQFTRRIPNDRGWQMSTSAPSSIDAAREDIRRAQDVTLSRPGPALTGGVEGPSV
jgi:hypothetical protein